MTIIANTPHTAPAPLSADPFICGRCGQFEFCECCGTGPTPGACMSVSGRCTPCLAAQDAQRKALADKATMADLAQTLTKASRSLHEYNAVTDTIGAAGDVLSATWVECVNDMLASLDEFAADDTFRLGLTDTWQTIRTLALILSAAAND